jgi:nicotinate (nicotinamide) nucleotide adenylyltransferase
MIYGLSANPPTLAHLRIIETCSLTFDHDFWVIPTFKHPVKTNLIDYSHRLNMLHIMCCELPSVVINNIESYSNTTNSYELIQCIRQVTSYTCLYFIVDVDIIKQTLLLTRTNALELIRDVSFIVILNADNTDRDIHEINELALERDAKLQYLCIPCINETIRSTNVRNNINKQNNSLHPEVYAYIVQHRLYEMR